MITTARLDATGAARRRAPRALSAAIAMALLSVGSSSAAQDPQAPPPPPSPAAGQAPPPGAWAGWGYPPGAGWAPYPYPAPPPKELAYSEGMPAPPGYHLETSVRKGLVIAGASMFGVAYLVSVAAAASSEGGDEVMPLYIPVAGPFITMAQFDYSGDFGGLALMFIGLPLLLDGLVQTAGAVMLVTGVAAQRTYWERDDVAERPRGPRLHAGLPALSDVGQPRDHRGPEATPQTLASGGLTVHGGF